MFSFSHSLSPMPQQIFQEFTSFLWPTLCGKWISNRPWLEPHQFSIHLFSYLLQIVPILTQVNLTMLFCLLSTFLWFIEKKTFTVKHKVFNIILPTRENKRKQEKTTEPIGAYLYKKLAKSSHLLRVFIVY